MLTQFMVLSFAPGTSLNGKMLATASGDNTIKLWDTSTFKEIKTLTGHKSWVTSVSFSRQGKTLASGSGDNTIKLWDTSTFKELKTLTGHTNYVNAVSFSPDGTTLASASADRMLRLWSLDFNYLFKEGCNFVHEYFKTNPPDNNNDRHMCDSVGTVK